MGEKEGNNESNFCLLTLFIYSNSNRLNCVSKYELNIEEATFEILFASGALPRLMLDLRLLKIT